MKSFWNNYKSSIVLLGAILLGGIVGATMGEKAVVLKPIGELFLNLLFMTLVPLVMVKYENIKHGKYLFHDNAYNKNSSKVIQL